MEVSTATILAAAIGAAAGILGGIVTNLLQSHKTKAEWKRARQDQLENNLRSGTQELVQQVGAALHSMCWLTWLARERPERMTQDRIDAYDAELHSIAPKINGALGAVAALDSHAFKALKAEVDSVLAADWEIGTSALHFDADPKATTDRLSSLYDKVSSLHDTLPEKFGSAVNRRIVELQ